MNVFIEISIILVITALVSFVTRFLKQPLIVGYIFTGILVGPNVLNLFHSHHEVELFSKIGIAILLFIVGLHLSPHIIKDLGKVSLATGVGQILFTSVIGFVIAILIGIPRLAALYTAIALTFSSTIIIIKLLSDKRDLNKLYGKIAVGFLLVQDIIATVILIFISTLQSASGVNPFFEVSFALLKGLLLITVLLVMSSYILPKVLKAIATSQELMFLVSLAWGLGLASAFQYAGFSVEIGALVAGVALASTPYAYEIGARMKPLRDFFIILFFILLGATMVFDNIGNLLLPTLLFSVFVLIGNPIIVVIIMNLLGYTKRTGFQAGLAVAQISEFSLILASIGFQVGHLNQEVVSLITLVGLITISASTYMIMYSDKVYNVIAPYLSFLELRKNKDGNNREKKDYEVILFGYDRVGSDFVKAFQDLKKRFVVVDYNPNSIERLEAENIPFMFGDADDVEFLEELNFHDVSLCVSTVPEFRTNLMITQKLLQINPKAIMVTIAQNAKQAEELYEHGAAYVIVPHYLGARFATRMITKYGFKRSEYAEEREKHLDYLQKRTRSVHPPVSTRVQT